MSYMKNFEQYELSPYWDYKTGEIQEAGERCFRYDDPRAYASLFMYRFGTEVHLDEAGISYAMFHRHALARDITKLDGYGKIRFVDGIHAHLDSQNIVYQFSVDHGALDKAVCAWEKEQDRLETAFWKHAAEHLVVEYTSYVFQALIEWVYEHTQYFRQEGHVNKFETYVYTAAKGYELLKKLDGVKVHIIKD